MDAFTIKASKLTFPTGLNANFGVGQRLDKVKKKENAGLLQMEK